MLCRIKRRVRRFGRILGARPLLFNPCDPSSGVRIRVRACSLLTTTFAALTVLSYPCNDTLDESVPRCVCLDSARADEGSTGKCEKFANCQGLLCILMCNSTGGRGSGLEMAADPKGNVPQKNSQAAACSHPPGTTRRIRTGGAQEIAGSATFGGESYRHTLHLWPRLAHPPSISHLSCVYHMYGTCMYNDGRSKPAERTTC